MNLPFSLLPSPQQTQAAALFRDDVFGSLPENYLYEVDAAKGLLTGQRSRVKLEKYKKTHFQNSTPVRISSTGTLVLSDQTAAWFADKVLETVSASPVHAEAG
jgi:hypothetical protein